MKRPLHYAWYILAVCCGLAFAAWGIALNSAGIFFVPVANELGVSRGAVSSYYIFQTMGQMITLPLSGRILPKANIRRLLSGAVLLMGGSFAAMSSFHDLYAWYISGFLIGIAAGFLLYLTIPLLINNWFWQKKGLALGLAYACSGIGGAFFIYLGTLLRQAYSWRTSYLILGILIMVLTLPFTTKVMAFKPADKGLLPYGVSSTAAGASGEDPERHRQVRRRLPDGMAAREAVKTPSFYALLAATILLNTTTFGQHITGFAEFFSFPPTAGALAASLLMLGICMGKILLGNLNDHQSVTRSTAVFVIIALLGVTNLYLAARYHYLFCFWLGAVLLGSSASMGSVEPPLATKVIFGDRDFSKIYAYVATAAAAANGAWTSLHGLIFDLTGSYLAGLALIAANVVLSLGILMAAQKMISGISPG